MQSIYYLTHSETGRRLRYYHTRSGARIAQRSRNHRLGFHTRIERVEVNNLEYERCVNSDQQVVDATWVIEEDSVEELPLEQLLAP
jgi:hypothetical protein